MKKPQKTPNQTKESPIKPEVSANDIGVNNTAELEGIISQQSSVIDQKNIVIDAQRHRIKMLEEYLQELCT